MSQPYAASENGFGYDDDERRGDVPDVLPADEDRYEVFMPAVQQLVNALGGYEEVEVAPGSYKTVYQPGDSVLGVLKDLKKLWRKDDTDDERTVARCMAKAGLMKELIGLVEECAHRGDWGRKVALMAFDLIAALTWPIDVAAELKEMEDDEVEGASDYASLLRAQIEYKALILRGDTLRFLLAVIAPAVGNSADDKEQRVMSLGLHVVRNLLAIKDLVVDDRATGEKEELSTLQSTLIVQLSKLTYLELFLVIAAESKKAQFNPYNMLLLDIIHLILRSVRMQDLGRDQQTASTDSLRELLELEERENIRNAKHKFNVTRHSRFGTTISVRTPTQKLVLHSQSAITADPGKLLDQTKKTRKPPKKVNDDAYANLSPEAISILQTFARELLDSFNDYFEILLNDIKRERQKVRPADTLRALFVSRFMIEYLLLLRKKALVQAEADAKKKPRDPTVANPTAVVDDQIPLGLVAEMADIDTVKWVVARMRIAMDTKPVSFRELQAAIDCFTQTLLLLDAMTHSTVDEDQEVGAILQDKIYYNGDILDSAISLFTLWKPNMKDMLVTFFDCTIHFAYVLLRMLEKYSQSKTFMFVRTKGRAKPARKPPKSDLDGEAPIPEEYANNEEEEEEQFDDAPSYADHKFTFSAFERRFAQESVAKWLLAYLSRYNTLDDDQLSRVTKLMHRQVVKAQAEGLYFTVASLHLFRSIMDDKESLPKGKGGKDLLNLITFVLRQFFKMVKKDPFVIIDALLPKGRGHWQPLSSAKDDDDDMGGQRSRIREQLAASELEFIKKNNLSWSQQMGVVVSILVASERDAWVKEVIGALEIAIAERVDVVLRVDGDDPVRAGSDDETVVRNFGGPSKEAIEKFERHVLVPRTEDFRVAVTRDQHVKLMLTLLRFEKEDEHAEELQWYLPANVVPSVLETSIGALDEFLLAPPVVEDPKKLLRRRRKQTARDSGDEADQPKIRRVRKAAEVQTFKSAAFIYDSDDDEDADAAFFAREEQLRADMQAYAEQQGSTMRATGMKKRKRKDKKDPVLNGDVGDEPMDDTAFDADDDLDELMGNESPADSDADLRPARKRRSMARAASDLDSDASDEDIDTGTARRLSPLDPDENSTTGTPAPAPRRTQRIIDSDDE